MSQPPQYYHPPQEQSGAGRGAATRAATKATAYGGSEAGALIGQAVGPPIIGGVIGNIVGERFGEKAARKVGLDGAAGRISDDLASVVGQKNVDKMGEITLTALGYSNEEECVCCPCIPASQSLLIIMILLFGFNCYRIGVGIDYEKGCSLDAQKTTTLEVSKDATNNGNSSFDDYTVSTVDDTRNVTLYIVAYPCEFGFHYLTSGAAVWLAFLPFYITTLLGNCWRQCCCCLCDPLVCFACMLDIIKRYCCECGRFSLIFLIWYSMCIFQVIWACGAAYWLVATVFFRHDEYKIWDAQDIVIETVLASAILDILLAGSEVFHKVRLYHKNRSETHPTAGDAYQMNEVPQIP